MTTLGPASTTSFYNFKRAAEYHHVVFLQSETVFLAMVWGHAMHSLELAAASAGYILVSSPGQRALPRLLGKRH